MHSALICISGDNLQHIEHLHPQMCVFRTDSALREQPGAYVPVKKWMLE